MKKLSAVILIATILMTLLSGCLDKFAFFASKLEEEPTAESTTISEVDRLYTEGEKYFHEKKYADAISSFTQVITFDADNLNAYICRADSYFELAKTENANQNLLSAVNDYSTAISKGSAKEETKLYECYVQLADNQVKSDKPYDAMLYYKKAYETDKRDASVALAQKLWVYKLDSGSQVTYFAFNFDNTGYVFENDSVNADQSSTFSVSGNSVRITDSLYNTYNWEYNPTLPGFTTSSGRIEMVSAKSAFTDWYNHTSYNISNAPEAWTQADMNSAAINEYKTWDTLLNVIYFYLFDVLPENEATTLQSDELDWISQKEAAMSDAEKAYAGGTMAPLAKYSTGAGYTKARVEELINMMPTP